MPIYPFQILPYNISNLKVTLADRTETSIELINIKNHCAYFEEYFDRIGAKTILVENNYIDQHFLEDFAGYYVRCFPPYKRKCTRLHFFDIEFTKRCFNNLLKGKSRSLSIKKLQDAYLGFIVVKPLPKTIIGRTCLKTYPRENRRYFPTLHKYSVNLFGLDLNIDSLAFQEQDNAVAACATSALWSIFQGTGRLFQHAIPSPVEITKVANTFTAFTRNLPNNEGLTAAQMLHAIKNVGLEPYPIVVNEEYSLKSTLYAYLRGRIPLILNIGLSDFSPSTQPNNLGLHAVAITGYSLGLSAPVPFGTNNFLLRASRIDKIYAHDDQAGPFARMTFDKKKIAGLPESLSTSWKSAFPGGEVRAIPSTLLIPAYHKIRVRFKTIHDVIAGFDAFLTAGITNRIIPFSQQLEWDIHLTTVNQLKRNLLKCKVTLSAEHCKNILIAEMPRFIWKATAYCGNDRILDLLFDATDIEQGLFFIRAIEYNTKISTILRTIASIDSLMSQFKTKPINKVFEWFKNN